MNLELAEKAKEKLAEQLPKAKALNRYAEVMAKPCADALGSFAGQDEEFARAILDGDFVKCMESVTKKIGTSISDIDAYRKCAAFYFPGAKVNFEMVIAVNPYEEAETCRKLEKVQVVAGAKVTDESVRVFKKLSLDDLI